MHVERIKRSEHLKMQKEIQAVLKRCVMKHGHERVCESKQLRQISSDLTL